MAKLFGKGMTRQDILRSVGHISQLAEARLTRLESGRGAPSRAVAVKTGGGLEFTVLPDKCLDIFDVRFRGVNLSFVAKAGVTAPQYFAPQGEFHHYFQGGLLDTCGLRNAGAGGEDMGERHTLHGRIGNIAADNFGIDAHWQGDDYRLNISGEMREARLFGENLVLRRRIETSLGARGFRVVDEVRNESCTAEDLMLLYHINFGFPFLGPDLKLLLPQGAATRPRDAVAAAGLDRCREFHRPQDGYAEQCFYHEMPALADGETCVLLRNTALDLAVALRYNIHRLPVTTEWKCMASGDYALGIEPANCHVEGKAKERREGTLQRIEAFGRREFGFELEILQGGEIDAFLADHPLRLE